MSDATISELKQRITSDQALRIARSDAEQAYRLDVDSGEVLSKRYEQ